MTETRTVRATGPADLLALAPRFLGFHPENSLVMLTLGDADHPLHARVDLPGDPEGVAGLAPYLARVAARNGVTRVALVCYTDDAAAARAVVDALDLEMHAVGVELVCVVRADGVRWWTLDTAGETPGDRYDVSSHPLTAEAVVDGRVVLPSRRDLAESLVGDDPEDARAVSALVDAELARLRAVLAAPLGPAASRHRLRGEGRWVERRVRRFLEDGLRLDADDVARLACATTLSTVLRDTALAEITRADAVRHVDLWRDLVRRCPSGVRAAPAALLGFAAWLSGDGALAWCAVERALAADPGHRLAELLAQALADAVPPSTWESSSERSRRPPAR
jgi:Domain of unknown function (DUF4192)